MRLFDIAPNTHPVSDFISWQRDGTLNLKPEFQRRSVWKPGARSYLVDTIVRGLPVPLILLRERLDLAAQRTMRDVVDGQQRLRTLFAFIDPSTLEDFEPGRDRFTVKRAHNARSRWKDLHGTRTRVSTSHPGIQVLSPHAPNRSRGS